MKSFKYTARPTSGDQIKGVVEANTREDAIAILREGGLVVSRIEDAASSRDLNLSLASRRTREKALSVMCSQFAIILQSGMPIVRTLQLIAGQTEDKALRSTLTSVADDVSAGYGLADSFAKHGPGLPVTFTETIRSGEASGSLERVFERLASYYEASAKTRAKVRTSMVYPVFVIVVALVVIALIMAFAVPTFTTTFKTMDIQMPWITQLLIDSSNFWVSNFIYIALVALGLMIAVAVAKRNDAFHLKWSRLGLDIPILGRIKQMSCAAQYASTMSVMMEAGLSVVDSVSVASKTISNYYMASHLASTRTDLEAGKSLSTCLAKTQAFPELVVEMTGIGEQTGTLEHTLDVLAQYYDNEVETTTTRALSILEPAIIIVLAVIVCCILLAVYLPMFSLYGGFGSGA